MEQERQRTTNRQEANKVRPANMRGAFIAAAIVVLAGIICVLAYFVTKVRHITVSGNSAYSADRIINLSGLYTGKNILLYDLGAAKRNVEKDPYLKCSVRRVLPATISLTVTERTEYAAILLGGGSWCVIDETGFVLDVGRSDESVKGLLPIYGLGSMGFSVGTRIDSDASKLRPFTVMRMIESIGERVYQIKYIDISNSSSVKLVTSNGVTVMLGDSVNIPSKIDRMFRALPKVDVTKSDNPIIYVNSSGTTDISYPTPIPSPTPAPTDTPEPTDGEESGE